jgi:hypothetical protein
MIYMVVNCFATLAEGRLHQSAECLSTIMSTLWSFNLASGYAREKQDLTCVLFRPESDIEDHTFLASRCVTVLIHVADKN